MELGAPGGGGLSLASSKPPDAPHSMEGSPSGVAAGWVGGGSLGWAAAAVQVNPPLPFPHRSWASRHRSASWWPSSR